MKKLSASKVALELDVSATTLTNWYKWYENPAYPKPEDMPELPPYEKTGIGNQRFWNEEDIPKIKKFQDWIPKGRGGVMGIHNAKRWGERGRKILEKKNLVKNE